MGRMLDVDISDEMENLNLKIFEEDINEKTIFSFEIRDMSTGQLVGFRAEEKIAAILFEGLSNIFENDDSEFQYDFDECDDEEDEDDFYQMDRFFEILGEQNKEFFG